MQLIDSSVREIIQGDGIDGMLAHIDYCAGICYNRKSYHKDPKKFVTEMIAKGHLRPLEFGTCKLVAQTSSGFISLILNQIIKNRYSIVKYAPQSIICITTNFRVIVEAATNLENGNADAETIMEKCLYFLKENEVKGDTYNGVKIDDCFKRRRTFAWVCSRGIADEFRTHVSLSSLMKSTRYVDETKGNMQFVKPYWYGNDKDNNELFEKNLEHSETVYHVMRNRGMQPQQARELLPLCLAVELYQCGVWDEKNTGWDRFIKMRNDSAAHPDAQKLCKEMMCINNL